MTTQSDSNPLVGKTITKVTLSSDKMAIRFTLKNKKRIIARSDAECCSHSWIESVEAPALGFPAKVLSVEDLDLPEKQTDSEDGIIAYYGLKIVTDKGDIVIDYRNESNGYYGGELVWPGEYFYGGVYGQNVSTLEFD